MHADTHAYILSHPHIYIHGNTHLQVQFLLCNQDTKAHPMNNKKNKSLDHLLSESRAFTVVVFRCDKCNKQTLPVALTNTV